MFRCIQYVSKKGLPIVYPTGTNMKIVHEQLIGSFPTKDMQTGSVLIQFSWMMRNVLKRMKNKFSDFSDFQFSSYHENESKIEVIQVQK